MDLTEIQQTILEIYQNNITYIQKNHYDLYQKIKNFESLNIENWYIDFINGRFELCNIDGTKIYNCDPFYDAKNRVQNIEDASAFTLIKPSLYTKGVTHYSDGINGYEFVNDYINHIDINNLNLFAYAKKFIFIGTILGVHINDIAKTLKHTSYLIVEDDIEIFRLSLFTCDYTELSKNAKIFFAISCDDVEFDFVIQNFLNYKYEYNHFIPFNISELSKQHLISKLNLYFLNNNQITYPFSEYLISLKRGLSHIKKNGNGVLKLKKKKEIFQNTPIIFLGAGPSLAKNIEWLYLYQDHFLIVCASATLKKLDLLGIIPDIIITMDGQNETIKKQFQVSPKIYENSLMFFTLKIDLQISSLFKEENIFYIQDSLEIFEECGINTGVTVGDTGLKVLLSLGATTIYMLGFDAALDSKSGKSHIGGHSSSKRFDITKKNDTSFSDYSKDIIWIRGNFEDEVPTLALYKNMIDNINLTLAYIENTTIYNLSNGAYFENSIPLKTMDFNGTIDFNKQNTYQYLKDNLASISQKNLTQKEILMFDRERKILKKLKTSNFKNIKKDIQELKSKYNHSISLEILVKYLLLCEPYHNITRLSNLQKEQILYIINDIELSLT